mgnify:CR=1 FL=1
MILDRSTAEATAAMRMRRERLSNFELKYGGSGFGNAGEDCALPMVPLTDR